MMLKAKAASNTAEEKQPAAPAFKAPAIGERIKAAQAKLATLQERHKLAALDSINGAVGDDLAIVKTDIKATLAEIEDLTAAHAGAVEADERTKRQEVAAQHQSQIRACRAHLSARQKAAESMSAAIEEAVKQFRLMVEHSQKARSAIVIGAWPNFESFVDFPSIKRLVEQDLFRLGGDPTIGNKRSFPGAAAHDLNLLGQPEMITPIATKLSSASEHLLTVLTGKVVE